MKRFILVAAWMHALGFLTSATPSLRKSNDANRARNLNTRDNTMSHHSTHSQNQSTLPFVEASDSSSRTSTHSQKGSRKHRQSKNIENGRGSNTSSISSAPASFSMPDTMGRKCKCGEGRSVIFIVESNTGSTWLGQILEHHPCSHSFVPAGLRPDGHYRGKTYGDLVTYMHKTSQEARGKSFGVLLAWNFLDRYMQELSRSPSGYLYGPGGPRIVLYNREAIFQGISLLKKSKLVSDRKHGVISRKDCENVNQRGGPSCKAAIGEKLNTPFEDLDKTVRMIEGHRSTARKLATDAARRFKTSLRTRKNESNFLEFSYSELVCAQTRRGAGFLPEHVAEFIGFGSECPTKPKETTAVKASPANPANSLSNLNEIKRRARSARRKWSEALERPIEAWPCQSSSPSSSTQVSVLPTRDFNATLSEQRTTFSRAPLPPPPAPPPPLAALKSMNSAPTVLELGPRNDTSPNANSSVQAY